MSKYRSRLSTVSAAALRSCARIALIGIAAAGIAGYASSVNANTVTGSIWESDPTGAGNATVANVPGTTPDVTFTAPDPLNFASGGAYTIGEFLASGNGSTVLTGASHLGDTLVDTLFDFKGFVTVNNGDSFTVGHDDGLTLVIGGVTVINAPGPTSFVNTSYTWGGASGTYAFELVYGECCGAPANLSVSLPLVTPVPEPLTLGLFGLGLVGLGMIRRRNA